MSFRSFIPCLSDWEILAWILLLVLFKRLGCRCINFIYSLFQAYGTSSLTLLFFSLFQATGMSSLKFYLSSPFLPTGRTGFNLLFGPFWATGVFSITFSSLVLYKWRGVFSFFFFFSPFQATSRTWFNFIFGPFQATVVSSPGFHFQLVRILNRSCAHFW